MDETPNLRLPYILAAQSQKHVTHNEAIRALDAVVQLAVLDRDLSSPPGSPAEGARYIVAASPSGAWSGQAGRIAAFQDGAWAFYEPGEGWLAWVADEDMLLVWSGTAWVGSLEQTPMLGINAAADTTNRLAVASAATLLNHAGAGHQLKINKAADTDTASLLFQTDFSGRAEMGLAGDDNWHIKVSPDGSNWYEAIVVRAAGGEVILGHNDSAAVAGGLHPKLQVHGKTDANPALSSYMWSSESAAQAGFRIVKSTSDNPGTHAAVVSGERVGLLQWQASDGTSFVNAAFIRCDIDATPGTNDMPGRLMLGTTADGSSAITEHLRIDCAGAVKFFTIGTTASAANAFLDSGASNSLLRSTSSARYKRDVEEMEPSRAARLLEARPIWYRSKCAADNPAWSWYGLLAEEVAGIDPRLVHWGYADGAWEQVTVGEGEDAYIERRLKDGAEKVPESVAYDRLTVGLLSLVQTLWARVEALEARAL